MPASKDVRHVTILSSSGTGVSPEVAAHA